MLSNLIELAGLACLACAAWLVAPALGLAVTGIVLVLVGLALDRSATK